MAGKADWIFGHIFGHIPKACLFRLLVPVGLLENVDWSRSPQSMRSVQLSDRGEDMSVNCFSLKGLKSPELCHDYTVFSQEGEGTAGPTDYRLTHNVIAKAFRSYQAVVVDAMAAAVRGADMRDVSGRFIEGDGELMDALGLSRRGPITGDLVSLFIERFPNFTRESAERLFYSEGDGPVKGKWMAEALKAYMRREYSVDLSRDRVFLSLSAFGERLRAQFSAFDEELDAAMATLSSASADGAKAAGRITSAFRAFEEGALALVSSKAEAMAQAGERYSDALLAQFMQALEACSVRPDGQQGNAVLRRLADEGLYAPGVHLCDAQDLFGLLERADAEAFAEFSQSADAQLAQEASQFPTRLAGKRQDYFAPYMDMFGRENRMAKAGAVFGSRRYFDAFRSARNDLCAEYQYRTPVDERLLGAAGLSAVMLYGGPALSGHLASLSDDPGEALSAMLEGMLSLRGRRGHGLQQGYARRVRRDARGRWDKAGLPRRGGAGRTEREAQRAALRLPLREPAGRAQRHREGDAHAPAPRPSASLTRAAPYTPTGSSPPRGQRRTSPR